jgi:GDP-L-fucose synthase
MAGEMDKNSLIYVAGHRGLVGSAIVRRLRAEGYTRILVRTHAELDLTRQAQVEQFFGSEKPDYVFLAAARVGGIGANSSQPADFIRENLYIGLNIVDAARRTGVKKLLNLGSSCIYPRLAAQPIREDALLSGPLEPTNEAYAIAKIAILRLCRHSNEQYGTNFISAMPTNLYGPGDNYDLAGSHVLPAMIRKFHEATVARTEVTLWGDGSPLREFLHADDMASASLFLMNTCDAADAGEVINVGSGQEISIARLAELVARITGYCGSIRWDGARPNGTPRKLLDSSRLLAMGWKPTIGLEEGIRLAYEDFLRL